MEEQERQEIQDAVKDGLDASKEQLVEDLKVHLDGQTSEKFVELDKEVSGLKETLAKRGKDFPEDFNHQSVVDMESRISEAEEKQIVFKEDLRLAIAAQSLPAKGEKAELDWGGRFLKVTPELKQYLRSYWQLMDQPLEKQERFLGSNLFSTGGQLSPETADAFLDFVIEQQTTLRRIVLVRMNAPQGHTDELRVSTRSLRKATEGVAPAVADSVTTARRTLTTVEKILAEDITMTLLEDAIERAGTEGHIARIIAIAFGNDCNDLAWNGDEASSDPFISINDGFLVLLQNSQDAVITDEDLSVSAPTTNRGVLQRMLQAMPDKFLGRTDHAYWNSVTFGQKYADEVATRETQLGDQVLIQGFPALRHFGIPLISETHIFSAAQRIILTPWTNLFWGVQRVMRIDSEFKPRKRLVEYTLTTRSDFEYATGEPVVNGTSVPAGLN
jgi:hypothetical protein